MRRYDEQILNLLLDKYERSLLYVGENKRRQRISVSFSKRTIPEYFNESSLEYDVIHSQMQEIEEKGFLRIIWRDGKIGHIIEKCELVPENTAGVYTYLKRTSKTEKKDRMIAICQELYSGADTLTDQFLLWCLHRLQGGESLLGYSNVDNADEFRDTCRLMRAIETNTDEIFLREFSIRHYHDSKIAEKSIFHAANILRDFSEENENFPHAKAAKKSRLHALTAEEVLEEFGIYKNPSWVLVKGYGKLKNPSIDLREIPGGIGISSQDILNVVWNPDCRPKQVITIENLTSFHRWNISGTLAIYLGGYHNRIKRAFLQNLYRTSDWNSLPFFHFGDIDVGGFRIWRNLREKTEIPFETYQMEEHTFRKYQQFGRPLTQRDQKELQKMIEDPYYHKQRNVLQEMLNTQVKLEQECI